MSAGGVTYYPIVAKHSGKCSDVANASLANGGNVQQFPCQGTVNQLWRILEPVKV